ncbi:MULTISPECIES: MbeB family mobilization protein [Enterobacterales]|uniref:Putative mobilization protein MobB n=1 Tax=Hafnia alvei TaxID=569 RepID=Q6WRW6_HAFAL|nr:MULTISPECIES: MbeB family mobilization protein [Enterobacterales]AAQ21134.1 putative mobilization protein MobB [Hafnia alvei]EAQ6918402.1 mobilization protein [Salmonella enterica]RSC52064.1 mobilization protein [Citrobacter amalonaticus]EBN2413848.1 mobilization protein [Salmonella enterica]ECJ9957089.1 mobilization protein [Salmonella enterica]
MDKIFDLAKDFEQKSTKQASTIEANLAHVFKAHENAINTALHSSGQRISSAIQEQSLTMRWMVLKSWLSIGVGLLVMLCLGGSVLWWQGTQIRENAQLMTEQSDTLKKLNTKTWGIRFQEDTSGRFLVLPKGVKANPNWTFEDGTRQGVKLERK